MKFALERWQHLIFVVLNPLLVKDETISPENLKECATTSQTEKENIKIYLLRKSLKIKIEKEFELLVQRYQAEIIVLLDIVFEARLKTSKPELLDLYNCILHDLEEVLSDIERRYCKYFSLDEKVPKHYLSVSMDELRKKVKKLQKIYQQLDEGLSELVFTTILKVFTSENITYRKFLYVKEFIKLLEQQIFVPYKAGLQEHLIYMNFNANSVVNYFINSIVESINPISDHAERIEKLAECYKKINQMQAKPGVAFKDSYEHIRCQVNCWISEEMCYLKERQRLFSVMPAQREALIADEEKLHFSVSVDVLTIFARAAKDSQFILNKHSRSLFKTLSRFCRTANVKSPSAHSMLNKSYSAERSSKQAAINILHEMIRHIHKYCIIPVIIYSAELLACVPDAAV